ncbi:MAG TPA: ROK family protein [Dehalococcoidia bacterium]|nr:ROK family protein [Dehalococcoidia bacterium]
MAQSAPQLALTGDIGGTMMRAALIDRGGRVLARRDSPTEPSRGLVAAAQLLAAMLTEVRATTTEAIAGVGISTAGPVDPTTGIYRAPPNLGGWDGMTMVPAIEQALGLPVAVGHDATLAAMAEVEFGAGQGMRHLLYVTVSTGIGAGIVADGRPITGATGGAGEAGHLIVQPGGPVSGAGCGGCLEAMASGSGIAAEARRRIGAGAQSSLTAIAEPTAREVFEAVAAGDAVAGAIIDDATTYLGAGLAGLLAVFDPELLVLGGGVIDGLRPRWDDVLEATRSRALPRYADGVPLVVSTLGDAVSLLGAAVLAFERP